MQGKIKMNKLRSFPVAVMLMLVATTALQAQEIFDAIRNGDLAKVKELVESDPASLMHKTQYRDTPLHIAALLDNNEIAQYLIEKGADINAPNGSLYTPLMRAGIKVAKVLVTCPPQRDQALVVRFCAIRARDHFERIF